MRPSPIDARPTRSLVSSSWNSWPGSETFYRDFINGNGSPLPKIRVEEMAPELANALASPSSSALASTSTSTSPLSSTSAFNFPLLPLPWNRRDWSLRQAGYNRQLKQLQLQQTWLGELQSPAKDRTYSQSKELRRLLKRKASDGDYQGPLYRPSISAGW